MWLGKLSSRASLRRFVAGKLFRLRRTSDADGCSDGGSVQVVGGSGSHGEHGQHQRDRPKPRPRTGRREYVGIQAQASVSDDSALIAAFADGEPHAGSGSNDRPSNKVATQAKSQRRFHANAARTTRRGFLLRARRKAMTPEQLIDLATKAAEDAQRVANRQIDEHITASERIFARGVSDAIQNGIGTGQKPYLEGAADGSTSACEAAPSMRDHESQPIHRQRHDEARPTTPASS